MIPRRPVNPGSRRPSRSRARGASLELFHALTGVVVEHARFEADAVHRLRAHVENFAREALERWCAMARKHDVEAAARVEWDRPAYEAVARRATGCIPLRDEKGDRSIFSKK